MAMACLFSLVNATCRRDLFGKAISVNQYFLKSAAYYCTKKLKMKGLVLGVYTEPAESCNEVSALTAACQDLDGKCNGMLSNLIKETGPFYKSSKNRLLWTSMLKELKTDDAFNCISVVDLGSKDCKDKPNECCDVQAENIRCAIADGIKALRSSSYFEDIYLDCCGNPQSVAEAACLSLFSYDELKQQSSRKPTSKLHLYKCANIKPDAVAAFERGIHLAESQNFARLLMEKPANLMTPSVFASTVVEKFKDLPVKVIVRDEDWIKSMKMGSFLSVARGSEEKPVFLEFHYNGAPENQKSIALVGKGITFDSGGISLKPSADMDKMRADMGGAACVTGSILAAAKLGLKINVKGFIPLTENMPSGKATKPGDVVFAMNGKSIQVDNTDAEGRLVLADALCYAQKFEPKAILDMATLTGAMMVALGSGATGVFSNDDYYWDIIHKASYITGDRVWRMPLFRHYTKQVTDCQLADLNNIGGGRVGGACTAAAFLQEFVSADMKWMHLDIAGVMENKTEVPYLCKGMSGRPTRTIVKFLEMLADKSA
ncbi:cytosol aminopeptidase-like [Uloborus diversus]|uniref:cytosol aminopeptidase-like n=1 Tax=Uloborus diversus TaxID=327109 RepID=UPI002409E6E2|nr:cytosol aminopeptidase-like [Uloborus diversus]